jgi:hypothetical protein
VQTAGERLEAIEAWSRRTFSMAAICAACLALVAIVAAAAGTESLRAKWAMQEGLAKLATISAPADTSSPAPFPRLPSRR